jgi:NIPSNAP
VALVIADRREFMKLIAVLVASVAVLAASVWAQSGGNSVAKDSRVFEMRTYYAAPGKLEDLQARFRNHTTKLFEKHGMTNIGYWVPVDGKTGEPNGNTLVYILAFPSLEARQKAWDGFRTDPAWTAARDESERNGKLVEKVDSVFLKATDYSGIK